MTVAQNDVVEIAARAEFRGVEDVVNVYQFQLTSATPMADGVAMIQLGGHINAMYLNAVAYQTSDFLYRDLTYRNITTGLLMGVTPWPSVVSGTAGATNNPPGIAGVINMATTVARVILRKYIGGLTSTLIDADGTFSASVQAMLLVIGNYLIGGLSSGGDTWEYGHLSPKTLGFEVPASATATDIPGYQRRRKQGRGV